MVCYAPWNRHDVGLLVTELIVRDHCEFGEIVVNIVSHFTFLRLYWSWGTTLCYFKQDFVKNHGMHLLYDACITPALSIFDRKQTRHLNILWVFNMVYEVTRYYTGLLTSLCRFSAFDLLLNTLQELSAGSYLNNSKFLFFLGLTFL